jgi:bifunctional non-homologous end joining protein LigD
VKYTPQLATLVKTPPAGDLWLHEIKYDGYRIGCLIRGGRVSLISRNGKDWTAAYPVIVDAAKALDVDDAVLDGEVAVVLPDGRTSFQALQHAQGDSARGKMVYFAFDLLRLNGQSLVALPLEERKQLLLELIGPNQKQRFRFSQHVLGSGTTILDHACRLGLEGIVSKRRDLPYAPGRSDAWLKIKCVRRQEFVIGGFTEPQGARSGIGALLLGHYHEGRLVFAGRVGTGFSHKVAVELRARLEAIAHKACPFTPPPAGPLARTAHWVKPKLVCEVSFTEWTDDGQLRHPSFQGLRTDKKPVEVRREREATQTGTAHALPRVGSKHGSTGRQPAKQSRPSVRRDR